MARRFSLTGAAAPVFQCGGHTRPIRASSHHRIHPCLPTPLTRANTKDNTPAIIHFDIVPGDGLRIAFMAKGGGSENMSRVTMLAPAQGWAGIKKFVIKD